MTPRALIRLDVPDTRVLFALYADVDEDPVVCATVVHAWEEGRSAEPPFVWRSAGYEALQDITGRSRSRVAEDLSRLVALNVIQRATRDGRRGWELLGTRPAPAKSPSGGTRRSQSADAKVPPTGPGRPNAGTLPVPPAGPTGLSSGTPPSQPRDPARAREGIKQEPDLARRGGAANDRPSSATATSSRASTPPVRAPQATRPEPPRLAPPQGPARALLLNLVRQFDALFTPVDADGVVLESRRIRADTETLRRLEELLTPPEDVDGAAWLERRVASVAAYVRDYATICTADPEQAHNWGGPMLEPRLLKGQRSAWEVLERIVDRWRENQATARASARVAAVEAGRAEARAVADRLAELEQLARVGEPAFARELRAAGQAAPPRRDHAADHAAAVIAAAAAHAAGREPTLAELEAAVANVPTLTAPADTDAIFLDSPPATPGVTPLLLLPPMQHVVEPPPRELTEDEEAEIRERGRRREGQLAREQLLSQRINAIFREFTERAGRTPTHEEAEQIRRRIRGEEATGT